MATTTMGTHTGWAADRTVYWAIGIALAIIVAMAFTRDRMAITTATPGTATIGSGYETGSVGVPVGTDTLQSSRVIDPTLAPVTPNVDTPASGAINTAPVLNQRFAPNQAVTTDQLVVPTVNDPVVGTSIMPRVTPSLENDGNINSRMNRANGAYSLDAQDRARGPVSSRQQFTDDYVLGTNGTNSTGTSTGNILSNPGTSNSTNSSPNP